MERTVLKCSLGLILNNFKRNLEPGTGLLKA
jgi:hypothetical protein